MAKRVFTSFDFDNDSDLRTLLVGQSKLSDSPFEIIDYSLKEPLIGDWEEKIRKRIKMADCVIVLCGHHTDAASGVSIELEIVKEEKIPYFLLGGRKEGANKKPKVASASDSIYKWTWDNLKRLIHGNR